MSAAIVPPITIHSSSPLPVWQVNSLEHFCVNWTAEKVQHYYTQSLFAALNLVFIKCIIYEDPSPVRTHFRRPKGTCPYWRGSIVCPRWSTTLLDCKGEWWYSCHGRSVWIRDHVGGIRGSVFHQLTMAYIHKCFWIGIRSVIRPVCDIGDRPSAEMDSWYVIVEIICLHCLVS